MAAQTRRGPKLKAPSDSVGWVLSHPIRCRILVILDVRMASPLELSRELKIPLGDAAYHCRELRDVGMIEEVARRPVRGSMQHFYKAIQRPEITAEQYEKLSQKARMDVDKQVLHHYVADAGAALNAGTMTATIDHHMARIPLELDDVGWAEMGEAFADLQKQIFEIRGKSANRRAAAESTELRAASAHIAFFELPRPARNDAVVPWD